MRQAAYLFDRYGPSTAYAVCFTVNALCLLTGFPWLQENKKVSQQLRRHTDGKAKRGSHGGRGEVLGVFVVVCVHECGIERLGVRWERWGLVFWAFVEKLDIAKIKVSKEAQNEQTSRPAVTNSSNTDVQVQKKKFKLRDQTKTTPDTSQHRGDQGQPHIESWLSPETLWGGSFPLFETQSGPLVELQTNCCYTTVVSAVPLA